jgi:TolA-binding protein
MLDRRGDAQAALVEFDAYLAHRPTGTLAEEALLARALALRQLGRADEERATWQRLLAEHPGSIYSERARARLAQLR